MTDPNTTDPQADTSIGLPIQPTGSGVADLEIAYEQMRVAQEEEGDPAGTDAVAPAGDAAAESAAHPS